MAELSVWRDHVWDTFQVAVASGVFTGSRVHYSYFGSRICRTQPLYSRCVAVENVSQRLHELEKFLRTATTYQEVVSPVVGDDFDDAA